MREIKDYLHLYLGCNVRFRGQEKKGKINTEDLWQLISVHQMTYKKIITIEAMGCVQSLDPEDIIPILRPLSDMTEEEYSVWVSKSCGDPRNATVYFAQTEAEKTKYLLKKGFDLFELIESGLAIDKTKLDGNKNKSTK